MEKRRQSRYPVEIKLIIESLYKQGNEKIDSVNETIDIVNISRSGIGFNCKDDLPLDYYFNAKIEVGEKKHFYTVVKLIRKDKIEGGFYYGSEFVGLPDILSIFVEEYGESLEEKKQK